MIQVKSFTVLKKNALLIGINYIGEWNELRGSINDVNNIYTKIKEDNFNNIDVLTDHTILKPTRYNILCAFTKLLNNSSRGDFLFFYYSGHGSFDTFRDPDKKYIRKQKILTLDSSFIQASEFNKIINDNLKEGVKLFLLFDSCYNSDIINLKYRYLDSLKNDELTENMDVSCLNMNIIMITSGYSQISSDIFIDNIYQGAFTWCFLQTIKNHPNCSLYKLLKNIRELLKNNKYKQIPQLTSGIQINIHDNFILF